jgi:glutamyl-tRNA synthetase
MAKHWKDRPATRAILSAVHDALTALPLWEPAEMESALRDVAGRLGYGDKAGKLFQPMRVALVGTDVSPGIFEVLELLGRDRSLGRLRTGLAILEAD